MDKLTGTIPLLILSLSFFFSKPFIFVLFIVCLAKTCGILVSQPQIKSLPRSGGKESAHNVGDLGSI